MRGIIEAILTLKRQSQLQQTTLFNCIFFFFFFLIERDLTFHENCLPSRNVKTFSMKNNKTKKKNRMLPATNVLRALRVKLVK